MDDSASIIKDLGRSYIVSSLLPAVLFISLGGVIFKGFIPGILTIPFLVQNQFNAGQLLIFIAFIMWVAYCLFSIIDWTVRLYEGYYFPERIKRILISCINSWYVGLTKNIRDFERLKAEGHKPNEYDYQKYYRLAKVEYYNIHKSAPLEESSLLPTRFGNILLAYEQYPEEKYGMDGFSLWTRLLQAMPKNSIDLIEEKNNQMIFILNSSLLSYIIGSLAFVVGLIRLPCQIWSGWSVCHPNQLPHNFFEKGFVNISPVEYIVIGIVFLIAGYFIYRLVLPVTEAIGLLMRSGFDLYRFDLLRQLNLEMPATLKKEIGVWEKISEYMNAGTRLGFKSDQMDFEYYAREELTKGVNLAEKVREKEKPERKRRKRKKT